MSFTSLSNPFRSSILFFLLVILLFSVSAAYATIISGTSTTNSSSQVTFTQLALTKPIVSVGDLMIASIAVNGGNSAVITPPFGWQQIVRTDNDVNLSLVSYYKLVGSSEPTAYVWTINGQTTAEGGITPYSGIDSENPIDLAVGNIGFGTVATTTSVATTVANDEVIAIFATDVGKSNNAPYFAPISGMTQKYNVNNTPFGPSIASFDVLQAASGIVGSKSSAISGNKNRIWVAQQIALHTAPPLCSGGTITTSGGRIIHTFTTSGTLDCSGRGGSAVSVLVVGGGGGGGQGAGGGGGGGGVVYDASHLIGSQAFAVTVGDGGTGSIREGPEGTNGQDSSFDTITAKGGGLGGQWDFSGSNGHDGGNGGGAGANFDGAVGGLGMQGYNGGNSEPGSLYLLFPTAGGGGAGGPGQDGVGNIGGNGGPGLTNTISGSSVAYGGGGGGGGTTQGVIPGVGGLGGGGSGGGVGGNGIPNSGGGGGGAGHTGFNIGGTGGSGIVIISYSNN
jgi:hypothetical protein